MGLRVGQLAGLLAFVLGLGRLGRLLESGPEYPPWQLIMLASAFLGGVAWWLLSQLTTNRGLKLSIFTLGSLLLVLRISVPETLTGGILPSGTTMAQLGSEFEIAWRTIQTGIPPVEPFAGILALLAVLMWTVGAFFTWGNTDGPYAALFLPSLVVYFQFAVFDRVQAGMGWMFLSTIALVGSVISLALELRGETGRARDAEGRPLGRRSVALAVVMASILGFFSISVANSAADVLSEYGNAPWRRGDGLGPGPGSGVAYDGLVELRQRILNQSEVPVFTARLAADTPPGVNPYWKVDTLDSFDGEEWSRSDTSSRQYEPDLPVVDPDNLYLGTAEEILQTVQIQALNSVLAPTAGTPIEIQDPGSNVSSPRLATEFYAVGGVSVGVSGGLDRADQYQVRTIEVDRTADLGALATDETGALSPIFAAAAEAGEFPHGPSLVTTDIAALPERELYVQLPANTPSGVTRRALSITAGRTTDFEAAWMLQSWFRDSGEFTYSTDVTTGHNSLVLDDWLNDATSPNYRTGYCEQFAAAMAVLARSLDIPSRVVWGFTPGDVDSNDVITVRDTNAHAWVELWIEPYGWYPFDPTPRAEQTGFASQPPSITASFDPADYLEAPENNPADLPPNFTDQFNDIGNTEPEPFDGSANTPVRWWLIVIVTALPLLAVGPVVKRLRRRRRLHRVRDGDITAAWDEIVDRLTDLGIEVSPSLTPVEVAAKTDHALLPLAHSYSSTVYGGRSGQARESDLVSVEWWIERTFDGSQRTRAALSLKSFRRQV
jgi:transglutaminase-like putative cysteine protease